MPGLLVDWLILKYPTAKRQTLKRMVEEGRVSINGRPARRLKTPLAEKDQVWVDERPARLQSSLAPLELIHEDEDVLVVCKPIGLLTSTVARELRPTAIAIIRHYLAERDPQARAGVIHRLDRDASGLLVFSKHNDAYENLKRQFFHHTVDRVYTAVVHGVPRPESGRIETHLVELPDGSVYSTRQLGKGEHAITDYQTIQTAGKVSLLEVKLHTGRKHQIRTHLAQRGTPIVGDSVYGPAQADPSRLHLAATRLAFDHPRTGKRMTFEIPPPAEIRKLFGNA
jgi:23S rRNA pseudouridine1911/1915/1917 synthase